MESVTLFVGIVGVIVALVALLRRANGSHVVALVIAIVVTAGSFILARPQPPLSDGTICPGAFGGAISYGYTAQAAIPQKNADWLECNQLVESAGKTVLILWIIGAVLFISFIMLGRDRDEARLARARWEHPS